MSASNGKRPRSWWKRSAAAAGSDRPENKGQNRMKIIVPMAGMGKRMRPHTLTVPKPLIPVAGKPIVQWLVEDIIKVTKEKVDEIAYVIGDFGKETEASLVRIAENLG